MIEARIAQCAERGDAFMAELRAHGRTMEPRLLREMLDACWSVTAEEWNLRNMLRALDRNVDPDVRRWRAEMAADEPLPPWIPNPELEPLLEISPGQIAPDNDREFRADWYRSMAAKQLLSKEHGCALRASVLLYAAEYASVRQEFVEAAIRPLLSRAEVAERQNRELRAQLERLKSEGAST